MGLLVQSGNGAIPIQLAPAGTKVVGGTAIPIEIVAASPDAKPDGERPIQVVIAPPGVKVQGGRPITCVNIPSAGIGSMSAASGPAVMVYIVSGALFSDASLIYTQKVQALGPVGYWPQAEPSGTIMFDESGNGRNGIYSGMTLGNLGIGDGRTASGSDGATTYANAYSASLAAAFSGSELTIGGWFSANAWASASNRRGVYFAVDASNRAYLEQITTLNQIQAVYIAGGVAKSVTFTTPGTGGFFLFLMTVSKSGDAMKAYYADATTPFAQIGTTQTALGVWSGSLGATSTLIGASSTVPSNVWNGKIAHIMAFNRVLPAASLSSLAVVP